MIRDATPEDFAAILRLNEASVHFLSALTEARLAALHAMAAYHRVVVIGDEVVAFLLALREGYAYESVNYRWFAAAYAQFLYIDRVVVSVSARGRGLGRALYDDLFAFARRCNATQITCEFDVDPPNEASRKFHAKYGFVEVGSQRVGSEKKRVSLQAVSV